jgi:glycerol kinase
MMQNRSGVNLRTLRADGGASRNRFLMQFMADISGLEVVAAPIAECSPLGAAFLGALGMRLFASMDDISRLPFAGVKYQPSMPRDRAEAFRLGWKNAVKQQLAAIE